MELAAQTDLAGSQPFCAVRIGARPQPDRLPGQARDEGSLITQPDLAILGRLVLVENPVGNHRSVPVKRRIRAIDQNRGNPHTLASSLGPGSGVCLPRKTGPGDKAQTGHQNQGADRSPSTAARRVRSACQTSKPGLSRRTRSRTAAQAISLKSSFEAISEDCPKTRFCIF